MISHKGKGGGKPISDFFLARGGWGKPISDCLLTKGGGVWTSPFLADILCDQPRIEKFLKHC